MPTTLTPDVRSVLERSTIGANSVVLPQQLDRGLYERVNKVLTNAGGKWNRGAKAHVFVSDPRPLLGMVLETGESTSIQQANQAFYTPPELAAYVVELANVEERTVLEPSAGHGALAMLCVQAGARWVKCVEKDPVACKVLESKGLLYCEMDFLEMPRSKVERVVMNPPFTKGHDIKHVLRALEWLHDGGKLVSIMAGNTTSAAFQKFTDKMRAAGCYVWFIHENPAGSFKSSGTMVNTITLEVNKS
jgi:predicted RNA methylase